MSRKDYIVQKLVLDVIYQCVETSKSLVPQWAASHPSFYSEIGNEEYNKQFFYFRYVDSIITCITDEYSNITDKFNNNNKKPTSTGNKLARDA